VTVRQSPGQAPRPGANQGLPFDQPRVVGPIVAYIDGGARGNPGPAGFGVRIEQADGTLIEEFAESIGVATNNVAEYNGLLAALTWAVDHGERDLRVRADSELLVKQMRGEYKVKHPGLQPLYARARVLLTRLGRVEFEHVGREFNREADRLSNLGMDEAEARLGGV
jgi:ribonuclease HI